MDVTQLREELAKYNQEHLLQFWDDLSNEEKHELYTELKELNLDEVTRYFRKTQHSNTEELGKLDDRLSRSHLKSMGMVRTDADRLKQYENEGLRLIGNGKVAVLLLAGGQGTGLELRILKECTMLDFHLGKLFISYRPKILRLETLAEQTTGQRGSVPWYAFT
ncbi:UDP-N-acetylhexosamine pyrophosphorylase, partial [Orchesella cincta]